MDPFNDSSQNEFSDDDQNDSFIRESEKYLSDLPMINNKSKEKVSKVLNSIKQLNEFERIYLYLKMPISLGSNSCFFNALQEVGDNSNQKNGNNNNNCNSTSNANNNNNNQLLNSFVPFRRKGSRSNIVQDHDETCVLTHHKRTTEKLAAQWISDNLEFCAETSLARKDVYEDYVRYVKQLNHDYLVQSDFGKIMRQVFPDVQSRRLGSRGESKYCYSRLRKRNDTMAPNLPSLGLSGKPTKYDTACGKNGNLSKNLPHLKQELPSHHSGRVTGRSAPIQKVESLGINQVGKVGGGRNGDGIFGVSEIFGFLS